MAISLDNSSFNSTSFNCQGSILVIASNTTGTATFNGVSLTLGASSSGNQTSSLYYLINPPQGTFTIAGTITGNVFAAASYKGVAGIDASGGANSGISNVNSIAGSVTTASAGDWIVSTAALTSTNGTAWALSSQTVRQSSGIGTQGLALGDSNGVVSLGTFNYTASWSGASAPAATVALALKASATSGFFNFM